MALRCIQTSDLHAGRRFPRLPATVDVRCTEARLDVPLRLAEAARAAGAAHVCVAGDLFDAPDLGAGVVRRIAEAMAADPSLTWWILPGNHDPLGAPVWDLWRKNAPANTRFLDRAVAVEMEPGLWLMPAPIAAGRAPGDPTRVWDTMATPSGVVRLGLAHGSAATFGNDPQPDSIHPLRPARLGMAWAALGDWHSPKTIGDRMGYAGTPEPDGWGAGGEAWVLDLSKGGVVPAPVRTASLSWVETRLSWPVPPTPEQAVAAVARPPVALRDLLWAVRIEGGVGPAALAAVKAAVEASADGAIHLAWDDTKARPVYDPADAARMAPDGALRAAVSVLMEEASGEGQEAAVAAQALALLAAALEGTR